MADAWQLVKSKKYDAAVREYSRLHQVNPSSKPPLFNRGITHLLMGQPASALEDFQKIIKGTEARLRSSAEYIHAGISCWYLDRPDDAVQFWQDGIPAPYTDAAGGVELPAILLYASERLQNESLRHGAIKQLKGHWRKYLRRRHRRRDRPRPSHDDLVHPGLVAWPGAIVPFLLGEIDESALLEAVRRQSSEILCTRWQCAADFYIGFRGLCRGDWSSFQDGMRRSAASGYGELEHEYYLARWEVQRGFPTAAFKGER